ncbi:MAG: calcium/sodium antiporter [Halanaerobiaceae bacterium]
MNAFIHNYLISLSTLFLISVIAISLYLLSKGADILVDEAVSLSLYLGVPKMIIGATIVSLGTTLPEATVSVLAAINGNPDLALGNAIGSIITNTGLIIGLAALIGTLPASQSIIKRQDKIQIWSALLLAVVSLPFVTGKNGNISQWVGFLFLALLTVYIYTSIKWTRISSLDENAATVEGDVLHEENNSVLVQFLKLFVGILLVIGSSKILIPAVEITAVRIGIPQSIIAATFVAFGTSLPELITAMTAVKKGHGELAVGNVVGANILNILFVIGAAAAVTIGGLNIPLAFHKIQLPTMLVVLFTFRYFSKSKNEKIRTSEGITLLMIYLSYLILNYVMI